MQPHTQMNICERTSAHILNSLTHTHKGKRCVVTVASWGDCHTIRHTLIKAELCKNSQWSQYTRVREEREREREENREKKKERNKKGEVVGEEREEERLEHLLYKNRVGE